METFRFVVVCSALSLASASTSYYFVTDARNKTETLNSTILSSAIIAGDALTVAQQCRRNCALDPLCQAFQLALLQAEAGISNFMCNHYEFNLCTQPTITLQNTQLSVLPLWERLISDLKPKPCVDYCAYREQGDCVACRGHNGLWGLDCDIAPKLCSDYKTADSGWTLRELWPWGFYNRIIYTGCFNRQTLFISSLANSTGFQALASLDWPSVYSVNSSNLFVNLEHTFNWPLISELQGLSEDKIFVVEGSVQGNSFMCNYSGLVISAQGELTLNGSLGSQSCTGIPAPLNRAPFVFPVTGEQNCGAFWQFEQNVSVCMQRTNLLNFTNFRWDGETFEYPSSVWFSFI